MRVARLLEGMEERLVIQERLLNVTSPADLRRFSLNRMKAIAELPVDEQRRRFAALHAVSGEKLTERMASGRRAGGCAELPAR